MKAMQIILSLIGVALYYIILCFVLAGVLVYCIVKTVQEWWHKTF